MLNKFKKILLLVTGLLLAGLLVACDGATPTATVVPPTTTPAPTLGTPPATVAALVSPTAALTPTSAPAPANATAAVARSGLSVELFQNAAAKLDLAKELGSDYKSGPASLTDLKLATGGDNSITLTGTLEGGKFLLKFPANWNNELVLLAHGFRAAGTPGALDLGTPSRPTAGMLATILSQNFAYGYSAFSKPQGFAVKSGIESTQLLKKLVDLALNTKRAYILGESMGGNVTMGLIEKFPNDYAGAMPYCGVVAGWSEELRYLTDFRVIYDYFTKPLGAPITLPTSDPQSPTATTSTSAVISSITALFQQAATNPKTADVVQQIAKVSGANPDPISFLTPLITLALPPESYGNLGIGSPYTNYGKIYKGSSDDAALNSGVQRIPALLPLTKYVNDWYNSTGNFKAKVLSIHNLIDPLVPYEFEDLLKKQVAAKSNSQNLVQQVVDANPVNPANPVSGGPTHCFFTATQLTQSWNNLRLWVEKGTRPEDGLNITSIK